jgi:chromosome partitioning protein
VKKIAVYNIKGGVGKTTTSVNLACFLAKTGLSVLLWDLDPQGGSSYFFGRQNQNNNTHSRLFDKYITIYDVIHATDSYQIDVISNDALFSDQFMNKASRLAVLDFGNNELIKITLKEVEDDYDVCIMDCSPGRFMLHDNIFHAADLLLIPNTPAPLSVYCNDMLMESLQSKMPADKVLSFYNMVQVHKNLHRQYLEERVNGNTRILKNHIPFYSEIELITLTKQSIFHQIKESKAYTYYNRLWLEICGRMRWEDLIKNAGIVVDIQQEPETYQPPVQNTEDWMGRTSNG